MRRKSQITKIVGISVITIAAKMIYDKYKIIRHKFEKEERYCVYSSIKKYNAICESKKTEAKEIDLKGGEIKAVAAKLTVDLSLAKLKRDITIQLNSKLSSVVIIVPPHAEVYCDIDNVLSGIKNLVQIDFEQNVRKIYITGKTMLSSVEIIPVNFYTDDCVA